MKEEVHSSSSSSTSAEAGGEAAVEVQQGEYNSLNLVLQPLLLTPSYYYNH
jgi:hypothetical protein